MNLYLVRHGETEYNAKGLYYGWTDCPINETGRKQAEALKPVFDGIHLDRVVTSTLLRTKETAELLTYGRDILREENAAFCEINFGDWEGKSFSYISETDPVHSAAWWNNWSESAIPGGESFADFYSRVCRGVDQLVMQYGQEDILLVSHSGVISSIFLYVLGMSTTGFWKFRTMHGTYSHISIVDGLAVVERVNVC